jgi:tRNA-specific 2-thiouridylase
MISDVKTTYHPISELTGEYLVQIRYNSIPVIADIIPLEGDSVNIHFVDEVRAPAPGQSAVIYKENELIGGGIIDTILE